MLNIQTYLKIASVLLFSLLMLAPFGATQAQNRINMPYSIYGLGEVRFHHNYQNMGMGGISQAFRSNMTVNEINPASYTAVDTTSFIFDLTMVSHFYEQKTSLLTQQSDYISMGNLSFSFPLTKWWSFAAGMKPYSLMGYSIRDEEDHPMAGKVHYLYEGSGGLNQLFIGNAVKLFDHLSLGVNASYVFGDMRREASIFSDSADVFQTNLLYTNRAGGWMLGFGMQYEFVFANNRFLTVGATYGHQQDISLRTKETLRWRLPGVSAYDTLSHKVLDEATLSLPQHYGAGVFARFSNNWAGGIDYQWQNWESFRLPGQEKTFNNSYQLAAGIVFNPTLETYSPFIYRWEYTAGIRYGQSYLRHQDETINEFGISFGVHIPVRRAFSGIRIGFEYSQRGSVDDHFMQENFYRLNVGVNIYERWFIRRRFF